MKVDTKTENEAAPSSTGCAVQAANSLDFAILPDLPDPQLQKDAEYSIIGTVKQFKSPSSFSVQLEISKPCYEKIQQELNSTAAEIEKPEKWKPGKLQVIAAKHENSWTRGVAVAKKAGEYEIFLVDEGNCATFTVDNLRPVHDSIKMYPVCALQVN